MKVTTGIIAIGLVVAFAARQLLPGSFGITWTSTSATRYVSLNIVVFWLSVAITILLCFAYWVRQMKMR
jgi:hypothetical protein